MPEVKYLLKPMTEFNWNDWRKQWRNRRRNPEQVAASFGPDALKAPGLRSRLENWSDYDFPPAVTPYYLSLADPFDPNCPILAQVLPDPRENQDELFETEDPLAEETHMPVPALSHRYPDRVLWYVSHNCAVHCRFCLRRRKVSRPESSPRGDEWEQALTYISETPQIKEVILSGGDPLSLSDSRLEFLLGRLRKIPHLSSIRIHTRMPVTLPMRVTDELAEIFRRFFPLTLVTHFNHARELSPEAGECLRKLKMSGVSVLNQAVLLRGVNDSLAAQEELHLGLVQLGAIPYYLHQCDEVRGVSHFRVSPDKGLEIVGGLRGRNPGISLPRYVLDLPGGGGKIPLENDYRIDDGRYRNWAGDEYSITE